MRPDKLILVGDIIGYQFAQTKMGQRTVRRRVRPIGFVYNRQFGIARWKFLDWLCVHLSNERWHAIDTMQSREVRAKIGTRPSQLVYKIKDETHQETGQILATWFYDGVQMIRTHVISEQDDLITADVAS